MAQIWADINTKEKVGSQFPVHCPTFLKSQGSVMHRERLPSKVYMGNPRQEGIKSSSLEKSAVSWIIPAEAALPQALRDAGLPFPVTTDSGP